MSGRSPPLYCTLTENVMQVQVRNSLAVQYPRGRITDRERDAHGQPDKGKLLRAKRRACKVKQSKAHGNLPIGEAPAISLYITVDVPIYRPVVARPKRSGKQGKPVYRHVPVNRYLSFLMSPTVETPQLNLRATSTRDTF